MGVYVSSTTSFSFDPEIPSGVPHDGVLSRSAKSKERVVNTKTGCYLQDVINFQMMDPETEVSNSLNILQTPFF